MPKTMKTKRCQLGSNVIIYATSIVLVAVILVIGYNYVSKTRENMTKTDLILLKSRLSSDINSISDDYGSSKKVSYSLPSSSELCFADLGKKEQIPEEELADYPLIKDSIKSNVKKNAFVVSSSIFESYYMGNIEIKEPYFKCFKPVGGKASFTIEGLGNRTLIR